MADLQILLAPHRFQIIHDLKVFTSRDVLTRMLFGRGSYPAHFFRYYGRYLCNGHLN
jgi:hypothetical protein